MLSRPVLAAALLMLCACRGPADTVVEFHQALSQRDGERALRLLGAGTRAELLRRAEGAAAASGGAVAADPAQMISRGDLGIYPAPGPTGAEAVTATLLAGDEKTARVELLIGEARHEVSLSRESGGWRLELPLPPPPKHP